MGKVDRVECTAENTDFHDVYLIAGSLILGADQKPKKSKHLTQGRKDESEGRKASRQLKAKDLSIASFLALLGVFALSFCFDSCLFA